MLLAIFLFEKDRLFLSSLSYAAALTIYIPLLFFVLYFALRKKKWFLANFAAAIIIVFFVVPSIAFGAKYNIYLLKEWFVRVLKPFFLTTSYETYIDLRASSQSLPSAAGRMLGFGRTWQFYYMIPPLFIHIIIRALSALIILSSCIAVWNQTKTVTRGLGYALFLILALILPQYCIYYTWSWSFALYFAVLNYIGRPEASRKNGRLLLFSAAALLAASYSIAINALNRFSILFLATTWFWAAITIVLVVEKRARVLSEAR